MSQFFTSRGQSIGASASASVLPMNIQGWISFRMDWLDLLAVQGTLKSLLQHHSSKASILRPSAFFMCSDPIFCKVQSLRCNSYNLSYKEPTSGQNNVVFYFSNRVLSAIKPTVTAAVLTVPLSGIQNGEKEDSGPRSLRCISKE